MGNMTSRALSSEWSIEPRLSTSVGLHTNGYSLARKLFFEVAGYTAETRVDELGCAASQELLKAHRSYLGALEGLLESGVIRGLAHITGGGLLENIPRILPEGTA